jgi:hypothetical protein
MQKNKTHKKKHKKQQKSTHKKKHKPAQGKVWWWDLGWKVLGAARRTLTSLLRV